MVAARNLLERDVNYCPNVSEILELYRLSRTALIYQFLTAFCSAVIKTSHKSLPFFSLTSAIVIYTISAVF